MGVELQLELPVLLLLLLVELAHLNELEGVPAHLVGLFGELLDHLLELVDLPVLEGELLVALDDQLLHQLLPLQQRLALGGMQLGLQLGSDEGRECRVNACLAEEGSEVLLMMLQFLEG